MILKANFSFIRKFCQCFFQARDFLNEKLKLWLTLPWTYRSFVRNLSYMRFEVKEDETWQTNIAFISYVKKIWVFFHIFIISYHYFFNYIYMIKMLLILILIPIFHLQKPLNEFLFKFVLIFFNWLDLVSRGPMTS